MPTAERSPRVGVVVPSYRQGRFLDRALGSITSQRDVDVELVVVDAVSDDETPAVLDRFRSSIDVLLVEPDGGQADALAKGFDLCDAPLLTWLNADDAYAGPGALATLAAWLEREPGVDLVYGRRTWIDGDGRYLHRRPWRPFDEGALRRACYLPQECALFRRAAYVAVGGIDRELRFALDYDLWLRMLDGGSRFLSIPDTIGLFRVHEEQKTTARWRDVGLPEIARVQARHGGEALDEGAMLAAAEEHELGDAFGRDVNALMNGHRASVLGPIRLDRWWSPAA